MTISLLLGLLAVLRGRRAVKAGGAAAWSRRITGESQTFESGDSALRLVM
jgi:hypothetical protein